MAAFSWSPRSPCIALRVQFDSSSRRDRCRRAVRAAGFETDSFTSRALRASSWGAQTVAIDGLLAKRPRSRASFVARRSHLPAAGEREELMDPRRQAKSRKACPGPIPLSAAADQATRVLIAGAASED